VKVGYISYNQIMISAAPLPITLPPLPVVFPTSSHVLILDPDGVIETLRHAEAADRLNSRPALFCHRRWTSMRLGMEFSGLGALEGLDALELFAFVRPAQFCLQTPTGLGRALGLDTAGAEGSQAMLIPKACLALLEELAALPDAARQEAAGIARMMAQGGWGWAPSVLAALGETMPDPAPPDGRDAAIWQRLPEMPDPAPQPEPGAFPVKPVAALARLKDMLGRGAGLRPSQKAYTESLLHAFDTPDDSNRPRLVLAEAGTGTGKTLGYLAPATLWAEENRAPVWIATYTRSLQHQVVQEMARFYPVREERESKVVIRKGRENYLCLLNLEDALNTMPAAPRLAPALGLMARWAAADRDGDLTGSGFPAWLTDLLGHGPTLGLADRRGECIHSACRHYQKCFVERSRQRARQADIVVANHALVMIGATMAALVPGQEDSLRPTRYVFDEGHHVFDAADSAFSTTFSGAETADLRRWIRGHDGNRRSRARGLKARLEDILAGNAAAMADLDTAMDAARVLPAAGWRGRLSDAAPEGPVEQFLFATRAAIYARASSPDSLYNLEAGLVPVEENLAIMAMGLADALRAIAEPLQRLAASLNRLLADEADTLDSQSRSRLEGAARGLMRRASGPLAAWIDLLGDVAGASAMTENAAGCRPGFVDWMEATRRNGEDVDIGLRRHYLDPSEPFSRLVLDPAHGVVITSATLTEEAAPALTAGHIPGDAAADPAMPASDPWAFARHLSGAVHLARPALVSSVASPFDYASQTKIMVVGDVARDDARQTAAAMAALMTASGGGALGLFTAIRRLRDVHKTLSPELEQAGLPLYAQHIDAMNLQTLLQIFREDRRSCLLGTDAVRDGIDVPGEALQLIVFDRVPWPRPDMLFKARAGYFGRDAWSDRLTRMKLRQAFGRLVRRGDDRGVFVVLDSRLPSRMLGAFPPGAEIRRCGLAEAIAETRRFLGGGAGQY